MKRFVGAGMWVLLMVGVCTAACEVIESGQCDPAVDQNCECTDPNDPATCRIVASDTNGTTDATDTTDATAEDADTTGNEDTTTGAATCEDIDACTNGCDDDTCEEACYQAGSVAAQDLYDALAECIVDWACADEEYPEACIFTNCETEYDACMNTSACDACGADETCVDGACVPNGSGGPACMQPADCGGNLVGECVEGECIGNTAEDCDSLCTKLYECDGCLDCTSECISDCEADMPEWDDTQRACIIAANDCVELNTCFREQSGCDDYCATQQQCVRDETSDRCARACKAGNLDLSNVCWGDSCSASGCAECTNACLVLAECGDNARLSGRALADCWEGCDMDEWSIAYMTCLVEAASCADAMACTP